MAAFIDRCSKLRKRGVTLHLLLESDREEIPDVPAVYFVEPSAENIKRVSDGRCCIMVHQERHVFVYVVQSGGLLSCLGLQLRLT